MKRKRKSNLILLTANSLPLEVCRKIARGLRGSGREVVVRKISKTRGRLYYKTFSPATS